MKSERWVFAKFADVPRIEVHRFAGGTQVLIPDRAPTTQVLHNVTAGMLKTLSPEPPESCEHLEYEPVEQHELSKHGSRFWAELHLFSVRRPSEELAFQWLEHWMSSIPFNKCPCKQHFDEYIRVYPPDYKSLFEWGVNLHNAVNKRIFKPQVTIEEALELWTSRVL